MAALAAAAALSGPAPAGPAAACTHAQKQARTAALAAHLKRMPIQRRAYFAKGKSAQKRSAFVRRQRAQLEKLRAAAACTVPSLPPSSGASCDFELAPNAEALRNRPFASYPLRNLGPLDRESVVPARGRIDAVMVFVDFPNAPAGEDPSVRAPRYTSELLPWLQEASHGRLSLGVTVVPRWFRMPKAGPDYGHVQLESNGNRYLADVAAVVGGEVDLARYQVVLVVPSVNSSPRLGVNYVRLPGRGVAIPGGEIRFGILMDAAPRPFDSAHTLHRFMALIGGLLIDSSPQPFGHWDPGWAVQLPLATVHPIAWHKWMFRWIDPGQITCLHEAGQLEETLTPSAQAGGKKMVVLPTGASTAYVLEVRRRLGHDRSICRDGVLVYTVDSQLHADQGAIAGRSADGNCSPDVAPFDVGQTYEDSVVKIEVLATDGSAYRVRVTRK